MTDEEQEARSFKYEQTGSVIVRQLRSGRWAMYPIGSIGSPFWIGDAAAIESAYAARPAPVVRVTVPAVVHGIDLSKMEINI